MCVLDVYIPVFVDDKATDVSSYEQVDFTTRKSVEFYAKAKEQGIRRNNIDWLIEWINDLIQDPSFERKPLLSQHRLRNIITSTCSVQPVQYDVSSYFQSAALWDLLEYQWRRIDGGSTLKDVFNGAAYREMRYRLFQQLFDIGMSIFHDGFNVFKRKSYTITVAMAMLLNLPPKERYLKKENLLLLATIPGPEKPKMIDSFLRPIREELKVLQEDGMRIITDDGVFNSRVQLIFTGGDIPALGDLVVKEWLAPAAQYQIDLKGHLSVSHKHHQQLPSTSFTISIHDKPGTTMTLDQLNTSTLDEFDDLNLRSLLLNFYSQHSIHHNNNVANAIHTLKNLTIRGHIFSVSTRQNAKKLNFAKITLPFDLRARRGQRSTENLCWGETFGTILLLFTHEQNEKTRALCLVRLELDTAPSVGSGIPCGNRQRQRLYVTEASHLDCLAMELKSLHVENKFYYLYTELFKHSFLDSSKI
ncbi:hypothetical protein INT45_005218 [Circinella minor]|uniref:Uncharacterized protein n=1 Tax=Circinella minor TaxID=1195481 RepID=A0A8H7RP21_9FUNG|nr:hypothetical protein INT45_005218 [Circinella minor]